jgi:hypothetical protein
VEIKPLGRWYGTVQISEISAPCWFEVFDCQGAFDVILGKPWLRAVKAIHDYDTDEITISHKGSQQTITNSLLPQPTPIHTVTNSEPDTPTVIETSPEDQLNREWARIHQVRASPSPWKETRWAQYLEVDPMEDEDDETSLDETSPDETETGDEVTPHPLSEKERRQRNAEVLRLQRHDEGEILLANAVQEYEEARERERLAKPKRKRKKRLHKT